MQCWALLRKRLSPSEWNMPYMHLEFVGVSLEGTTSILKARALGRRDAGRNRGWAGADHRVHNVLFFSFLREQDRVTDLLGEPSLGWVLAGWIWLLGFVGFPAADSLSSHSYQQCAGCNPSLKYRGEPLLWSLVNVQHLVCTCCSVTALGQLLGSACGTELLLRRELAQHLPNRAALQIALWSVLWVYYWEHRKFFLCVSMCMVLS